MSEHTIGLSRRTFLTGAAALGALSVLAPTTAFAETAAEKQAEADAVRNQLIGLQADLEAAEISYYSALDERDAAQKAMEDQQAKIDDATARSAICRTSWARVPATCTATDPRASSISSWVPPRSKSSPRIGIFSTR